MLCLEGPSQTTWVGLQVYVSAWKARSVMVELGGTSLQHSAGWSIMQHEQAKGLQQVDI